jgi:cytochrome c-type biogenesis protein CcmH
MRRLRLPAVSGILSLFLLVSHALALGAQAPLPDSAQEARARALFYQVRCAVCEGQSVADSPAEVAADMRAEIRRQVASGESDRAILSYLASRYGDGILMRPPVNSSTLALWLGPLAILALAALAAVNYFRRGRTV